MEASFWNRIQDLRQSINGGVEPLDEIKLPTRTIKFALGFYLTQTVVIALWWSIKDRAFFPWTLVLTSFLQVGWFWSKVTDSWKHAHYTRLYNTDTDMEHSETQLETETHAKSSDSIIVSPIDINNCTAPNLFGESCDSHPLN